MIIERWGIPPKIVILMGNNKELVQERRERRGLRKKVTKYLLALI